MAISGRSSLNGCGVVLVNVGYSLFCLWFCSFFLFGVYVLLYLMRRFTI